MLFRQDFPESEELYSSVPELYAAQPVTEAMCRDTLNCGLPKYKVDFSHRDHVWGKLN
jgi:hypothetical protein